MWSPGSGQRWGPRIADPSNLSPTSPSPYNEGRPSSLLPNADAAQPAAGREALRRPLTVELNNLHILDPSASLSVTRYTYAISDLIPDALTR